MKTKLKLSIHLAAKLPRIVLVLVLSFSLITNRLWHSGLLQLFNPPPVQAGASTTTTTVATSTDNGSGNNNMSWTKRNFYDPNNDRWHILYIDSQGDIHSASTAATSGTSWTDGIDIEGQSSALDYDDFSCALDVSGANTYLHCSHSTGSNHTLQYTRCELTGTTPFITCGSDSTIFTAADSLDDVRSPNVAVDSNRCVLISASYRDNSVVAADEWQVWFWKEAATCGDGTWGDETGFPKQSIQAETGYQRSFASGIKSYGDLDVQVYYTDTDTSGTFQLETIHFDGDTNSFGTQRTIESDVEATTGTNNFDSVIFGVENVTFGADDTTTDLDAYIIKSKDGTLDSQVNTGLTFNNTTEIDSGNVSAVVDTKSPGADNIWLFATDNTDVNDIYYNTSIDGGDTWGTPVLWVNDFDAGAPYTLSTAFSSETCDIMLTWASDVLGTVNINTKFINTGWCTDLTQNTYRWYVDNDAANPTDPWSNVSGVDLAENTAITVVPAHYAPPDSTAEIRLRVNITTATEGLPASRKKFRIQYKAGIDQSCTSGSWTDVGASQTWEFASSTVTDGATVTNVLTTSDVAGHYAKTNPTAINTNSTTAGQDIEYDFHIIGTNIAANTTYSFRLIEDEGDTVFNSYTNCPTLTTEPGNANFLRHGNVVSEGGARDEGFFWAD